MNPIKFTEPELTTLHTWAQQSLPKAVPMIEDIKRTSGVYTPSEAFLVQVETAFDALTILRNTVLAGGGNFNPSYAGQGARNTTGASPR